MNILMILVNPFTHDPRVYREAKSLVKAGHNVTVLGWDRHRENKPTENIDGVNVVRSYNTRFMNLLPFDISKLHFWWKKGYKDAIELHGKHNFDVIHCHDLDTLPIGVKLKKKLGLPLIYDAHEIWGYMVSGDLPKIWANYYLGKEKRLLKNVDEIITVSNVLKNYFEKISNKSVITIMNCKTLIGPNYEPANNDKFTLLYLGALNKIRFGLDFIDVFKEIPDTYCIIGGKGKPEFVNVLKEKCSTIPNVDFVDMVPMNEVIPMTKKADAVICLYDPNYKNNKIGLPNKLFEAMICGRPVISTMGTYSGEFTKEEKCGLVISHNAEDFKKAIIELKDNPKLSEELGKNALKVAVEKYNWEKQEEKLLGLYDNIKAFTVNNR